MSVPSPNTSSSDVCSDSEIAESERLEEEIDEISDEISPEAMEAIALTIDRLEGRRRCLTAAIAIAAPIRQVWQVLTDYERLAEFIPNLRESTVVGEEDDCVLLRQVGVQNVLFLNFSATVTLKLRACCPERIDFAMTEGDFKEFCGAWELSSLSSPIAENPQTRLTYTVTILPPRKMPVRLVERRLKQDLATNLLAIRQQAETAS
jgi:ribosome-associated toxin RatA of RatAB toxin-antitoxin module